jgi:hypothetical protein
LRYGQAPVWGYSPKNALRRGGIIIAGLFLFGLGACVRAVEEIPVLPPATPPLSRSVIGYGVISVSYTHVFDEPMRRAVSLGYLRRGSVAEVLERRLVNNRDGTESWVLVHGNYQGWIREEGIQIYDNAAQAQTAAETMTQ